MCLYGVLLELCVVYYYYTNIDTCILCAAKLTVQTFVTFFM